LRVRTEQAINAYSKLIVKSNDSIADDVVVASKEKNDDKIDANDNNNNDDKHVDVVVVGNDNVDDKKVYISVYLQYIEKCMKIICFF
jgi:hypothetical protein